MNRIFGRTHDDVVEDLAGAPFYCAAAGFRANDADNSSIEELSKDCATLAPQQSPACKFCRIKRSLRHRLVWKRPGVFLGGMAEMGMKSQRYWTEVIAFLA